jgi:RNA polymerase sigma-70 factor (ECF subfamily)
VAGRRPRGVNQVTAGGATTVAGVSDEDLALIRLVRAGDRRALEALLHRHYPRLWAVCRQMTGHDADASDATQNAMIAIVRGLPGFDGRSRFATWAYRVAVNASLDEIRRRTRRATDPLDETTLPVVAGADQGIERVQVDAALRRLPPDYRAAVVLRDLCGLDYAEIAEVLEIPPGTVRSRISRGRAALVPLLDGEQAGARSRPAGAATEAGGRR